MNPIILYATPNSPSGRRVKEYCLARGLAFVEYDVSADPAKARELIEKTGQLFLPAVDIGGQILTGFDEEQLAACLQARL
ncbi:MAG: Glutaredoxin-like protein, YruB-family [Candidatus Magasanikbacteria bacterium GW2011_GWA2_56_11]|uniref:Glutaredoxin-like protein, YruB-family n=1 Tax=Candidatus Magasanikbacteria bacterium GW2011_GWA2_56_11 TaxID=1619044 RepID=A0A0G1YH54_9BACT|nr:MAG: Glutaredoxin-like protein, YruB-family [Candidatus Magasanikbacteria bacterium GW2011_GWA2_56_11]